MKKSIPTPVVVAGIVAVCVLAGFAVYKGVSGPPEFTPPSTSKTIPTYVWNGMSPDMQKKMKEQGYSPGEVSPAGQPAHSGPTR